MAIEHLDQLSLLRIVISILAIYRLARLFSLDDGPLFIFKRIRLYADRMARMEQDKHRDKFGEGSEKIYLGFWSSVNEGLFCPFCMGLYMSVLCTALLFLPTFLGDMFLVIFGLAGSQAFLQRKSE